VTQPRKPGTSPSSTPDGNTADPITADEAGRPADIESTAGAGATPQPTVGVGGRQDVDVGGTSAPVPSAGPTEPAEPSVEAMEKVIGGDTRDPHGLLGAHPQPDGSTIVRTLRHHAQSVVLLTGDNEIPLEHVHGGIFATRLPAALGDYRLRVTYGPDAVYEVDDPYRWLPTLGEMDLHLIGEGRHEQLWEALGAHVRTYSTPRGEVTGTSFAVWAPNARGVRVTGDFDSWTGAGQPMRLLGSSGVWELFVPDVGAGTRYKYQILSADGGWHTKADPMAFAAEIPPATASVVSASQYVWGDRDWISHRGAGDVLASPMSIYEVHIGSWRPGLGYRQLADALIDDIGQTRFTHVEFLPLAAHPFGGSWGYQVTSYYAPDPRFGSQDDFKYLVDRLHQAGIGVILDWVPAHFPKDEWALARFDGTPLYEHADPRRGEQKDWGTLIFNFGRHEVRNFLVANALYWLEEFHIDGLRVDAVASMLYLDYSREPGDWTPNIYGGNENLEAVSMLQEVNATVGKRVPGAVMIAEESTAWPGVTRPTHLGGLGFHLKWNMGWMHDTLGYVSRDPIHRSWHHGEMTFSLMYAFSEQFVLPLSHDEVVHGKGSLWGKIPGDPWRKAATLRAYFAHMWAHPGKQLLFMGGELGNPLEWNADGPVPWELLADPLHSGIRSLVADLNRVYVSHPALYTQDFSTDGFEWIDANDRDGNVFSYLRKGADGSVLACVVNMSAVPHRNYRIGLPHSGPWREVVNSDSDLYGGSGVGNLGVVQAKVGDWHGQPANAQVTLPPLAALWFAPDVEA